MSVIAIYPGTFDPVTLGHVALIERAVKLCDQLIVAVATSARKSPAFSLDERMSMAAGAFEHLPQVAVKACDTLLVDFARSQQAKMIVRGLRAVSDFDYEFQLAGMNHAMTPDIETVFLPAIGETAYISSTMVREIVQLKGDVSRFVPQAVIDQLRAS